VRETSRDISFCAHAIQQSGLFIVPDATKDGRFSDNPLVKSDPKIRFYAGAPLITPDGYAMGTLCIIDKVPRDLGPDQKQALIILARHVVSQLELRRRSKELSDARQENEGSKAEVEQLRCELASARRELAKQRPRRPAPVRARPQKARR
jgi:GAF domain-containing protein